MGSRYGGLKQMDKIGAGGEALLDYSVYDALRAGFGKVVFVLRADIEEDFRSIVLARMGAAVPYAFAFQEQDSLLPPAALAALKKTGRTKPWGTAHALLCAKNAVDAPFAVINADDFYGREAYVTLAAFLSTDNVSDGAIVPYALEKTLSSMGTVTRGFCAVENGLLSSVDELLLIQKEDDGNIYNTFKDGSKKILPALSPVSMNFWGLPQSVWPLFEKYWAAFIAANAEEPKAECLLPGAIDSFIKQAQLKVKVLEADSAWFGVTYKEDRAQAASRIAELVKGGVYPERLWS
jgi:dTDP-glucose pyrophosphorylase